jgi:hypothetical protein
VVPAITVETSNYSSCANAGGTFSLRVSIFGKPGAAVKKYNRHASCGSAATWWLDTGLSGATIPSSGTLVLNYPSGGAWTCSDKTLGRWENYVVVGGKTSPVSSFTIYNKPCGGALSTCSTANNYCPPSGACNGPGC